MESLKGYYIKKFIWILLLPLGVLLSYSAAFFPYGVERYYSTSLYRLMGQLLSNLTGLFPFSVAEFLFYFLMGFIVWSLISIVIVVIKAEQNRLRLFGHFMLNALASISIAYFIFILIWGLNYHRLPFSKLAGLNTAPASVSELTAVCEDLMERANILRSRVYENSEGVMEIPKGYPDVSRRAYKGYQNASTLYPALGGRYGNPKGVAYSRGMTLIGVSGIYFPFTGEANVDIEIPDCMLPSTTAHEMAHQRGFAREDEANYIAYLTCTSHLDVDFQYSGTLLAVIYATRALYQHNPEVYRELYKNYDAAVLRDLQDLRDFWKRYEGPAEKAHEQLNNAYLKANAQTDGVKSYGRMVDLLIAEHRAEYRNKTKK